MKRKVFITGISSEIMRHFVSLMNPDEFDIIGLTRNDETSLPNVKMVVGDILDSSTFTPYLEGCDTIIHAAAITHSFSEKQYFQINLEGTKQLVDLAKANEVKSFVFVSSNTAGEKSGAYGLSKLLAEEYIKETLTNWVILRPSEIFGGAKKEGIEELIGNVITKSLVLCPKDVPTDFYPIHLHDAAAGMKSFSFDSSMQNTIQVVAGSKGYSFLDIIELVKSISKKKPAIFFIRKSWMYFIRRVVRLIPFSVGIIPDQIDRLYALKDINGAKMPTEGFIKLEDYVKSFGKQMK